MPSLLPSDVVMLRASGSGDMGTVGDDNVPGIFRHPLNVPWVLVFVRLHFIDITGGAAGTADCSIFRDKRTETVAWNALQWKMKDVGLTKDGNLVVPPEELYLWGFGADEAAVFTWTNPDSGNIGWGLEVGMAAQSAVRA